MHSKNSTSTRVALSYIQTLILLLDAHSEPVIIIDEFEKLRELSIPIKFRQKNYKFSMIPLKLSIKP